MFDRMAGFKSAFRPIVQSGYFAGDERSSRSISLVIDREA
jgi:hypothetical protein